MRCSRCGSTNITIETQPTSGYNFAGTLFINANKICHCMACGKIGDSSSVAMDYDTEYLVEEALRRNDVAKLLNIKRKYRNFEWTPPEEYTSTPPTNHKSNYPSDPNFDISTFDGTVRKYNGVEKAVVIPHGVTCIGDKAFGYSLQITSVRIPSSVKSIGDYAFSSCMNLSSAIFSGSNVEQGGSIGKSAFYSCKELTSINIPNGFISIDDEAFYYCTALATVSLPNSLISIGERAFSNCYQLDSIKIPDSVTSIGNSAFSLCCWRMTSVTLSKSLISIGQSAFWHCDQLKTITIPKSVTSIGREAFRDCKRLKTIYFEDPCGWTLNKNETVIESVGEKILSNPRSAAKFLKKKYKDYSL